MKYVDYIGGQKWFLYLKPPADLHTNPDRWRGFTCLEDEYRNRMEDGNLIVQWHCQHSATYMPRLYGLFHTYIDFFKYYQKIDPHYKSFFEVLIYSIKPYFDVDISRKQYPHLTDADAETIKDTIVDAIIVVFSSMDITLQPETDILLYQSHDPTKYSFHIVCNHYYCISIAECGFLYKKVVSELVARKSDIIGFLDHGIYNSIQHFRLLGSGKLDGMGNCRRHKQFCETWRFHGKDITHRYRESPRSEEHRQLLQLEESLVSFVANSKLLPSFAPQTPAPIDSNPGGNPGASSSSPGDSIDSKTVPDSNSVPVAEMVENITDSLMQKIVSLFRQAQPELAASFTQREIRNTGTIQLNRNYPSFCPLCNRTHEHENAYLRIWKYRGQLRIKFYCFRFEGEHKGFPIATLEMLDLGDMGIEEDNEGDGTLSGTNIASVQGEVQGIWGKDPLKELQTIKKEKKGDAVKGKEKIKKARKTIRIEPNEYVKTSMSYIED